MNRKNADVRSLSSFLIRWHEMNDDAQAQWLPSAQTYVQNPFVRTNRYNKCGTLILKNNNRTRSIWSELLTHVAQLKENLSTLKFVENVLGLVDFWRTYGGRNWAIEDV